MKKETYLKKLYEIYTVTSIPVTLYDATEDFDILYPKTPSSPHMKNHYSNMLSIIEKTGAKEMTPVLNHIYLSSYYCLVKIDDHTLLQLGPVASNEINFHNYYLNLRKAFPEDVAKHHMKLLQGAPRVDINYFIRVITLTMHFMFDIEITREQIILDKDLFYDTSLVAQSFMEHSSISIDHLSFEDEIFSLIKSGNIKRFKELQSKNNQSSFYFYQENDVDFLRISFIFYSGIACHYAVLGGLNGATVKKIFRPYLMNLVRLSEPQEYWKLLPQLSEILCQKVYEIKHQKSESEIINLCTDYIKNNLYSRITMTDLEMASQSNERTILRHFRKYLNATPSEYINDAKLAEVAFLLENSRYTIIDISNQLCYSSQSHLNRAFQKKYGCTPLQYRKNNTN